MNLNKQQIVALANQISKELNDKVQEHNRKCNLESDKLTKQLYKKHPILQEFDEFNKYGSCKAFLMNKYKSEFDKLTKFKTTVYNQNIMDEITLATIECDGLDQLIKAVKAKFV